MQAPGDNTYLQMPICIIKGEISARSQISNDMENLEYGLILTISKTLILQLEPGDAHPVPVSSSWSCAAVFCAMCTRKEVIKHEYMRR
uniref:Uncharacterized protein n=2 Tax=Aegilops tauschii subsp. strangulata TaxID=200361 RepID=A0A453LAM3_AEGTS